jgi:energy-coupling factor transporter ATP-binding protein EcfA2
MLMRAGRLINFLRRKNMQVKKKFVAVIGYSKSGKSTIISSLTGCRTSTFKHFINDNLTGNSVFVYSGSPQELSNITLSIIKKRLKQCKEKAKCSGMVIAIQPTKPRTRARMEAIFQEAMSQGFDVYAFVIEPGYENKNKNNGCHEDVKKRLASIGVPSSYVIKIDGRQFALKNANDINSKAALII